MADREFTGKHALLLFVGAFGVIIAVNIALAVSAVRTFPG
ncbi:MAG: FixH family protein, partial [Sedimentitalea sp.]|nr:FixH family protein [Sedimentitalea sp.]